MIDPKYNKYKWLDYSTLAKRFVSKQDQIVGIFYFTAYAHWNPHEDGQASIIGQGFNGYRSKSCFRKIQK